MTRVTLGIGLDQLEPNLLRALGIQAVVVNFALNVQGLKEGVDYPIKFREIEILRWVIECCKKILPTPKPAPKKK